MVRLDRGFFQRYTPDVAKELLGCRLVRVYGGKKLVGRIVETEAYRGRRDPASHAFKGRTPRNSVMFGEAGHAYVYFTMGMHYCLNVTTETPGTPGAVLIRAVEPVRGKEEMVANREGNEDHIADGPGKLTQAMAIDIGLNGEDLVKSDLLFIEDGTTPGRIRRSSRVGISRGVSRKWRYYEDGSRFVSHGRPSSESDKP